MISHVLERTAGVPETGALAKVLKLRARLMDLTQASHDAALLPRVPGGLSLPERAVLAARMARICGDAALAAHYTELAGNAGDLLAVAEPGVGSEERRLAALLAYTDKVTLRPKDAVPEDIEMLRDAGLAEGDIVRLAGLVAFVNYQLRVANVLRAMGKSA
ncbi:CMD domain-containing protein [Nitratireductor luteus]|uniref:CMD domain-containing protein n=1 Tax=Nitratireductor luteus TaxID=2976980 RepID=UPI0022405175|nr:hypothetical protein [Nitratireductor luteus]